FGDALGLDAGVVGPAIELVRRHRLEDGHPRMHAAWYFATVLVTHVANVLLLFAFVRRVTGSASLACFGAVMFAVSPANAGTLGWYSLYGHALAGALALLA